MKNFFVDLHVHLGSTREGAPVKVTASKNMTLLRILQVAREEKGLDVVGVVDTLGPAVQQELRDYCREGILRELPGGGLGHKNGLSLVLGGEVETTEGAHILTYFPTLENLTNFATAIGPYVTNLNLSSQRVALPLPDLLGITMEHQGIVVPAHAFTPHKGIYGVAVRRLAELFPHGLPPALLGLELGLSADTFMADRIAETRTLTFLTNSDAHSLGKLAREYNIFRCRETTWEELVLAIKGEGGRKIIANYGLDPRLGKYHRTWCPSCGYLARENQPVTYCPVCGSEDVILGVQDRIGLIADWPEARSPADRPPYHYHIPLEFIPGIGKQTLAKLLAVFGNEMNVFHQASEGALAGVVGKKVARNIVLARKGQLEIIAGGGGKYGKIRPPQS